MTEAHEVHLFDWIKDNLTWLGAFAVVMWAMTMFWYRTVINKFYPKDTVEHRIDTKLALCKGAVDSDTTAMLAEIRLLAIKVDHLDDRRRDDAIENAKQHGDIRHDLTMLVKGKD